MGPAKRLFYILILTGFFASKAPAQPLLPISKITITNFSVYEKGTKRIIDWATDGTIPTNLWKVQESGDGINFSTIAMVLGPDPGKAGDNYQYRELISEGRNAKRFYRICHIDIDGNQQFSEIIQPAK
jgi:hypothetical protein